MGKGTGKGRRSSSKEVRRERKAEEEARGSAHRFRQVAIKEAVGEKMFEETLDE